MSTLDDFAEVMGLVVQGKLLPVLDSTFPLSDAAAAQERLWRGESIGKITLDIPRCFHASAFHGSRSHW